MLADDEKVCRACGASWGEHLSTDNITKKGEGQAPTSGSVKTVEIPEPKRVGRTETIIKTTVERFKLPIPAFVEIDTLKRRIYHPRLMIFVSFLAILALKIWFAVGRLYQSWDGYVYLLNARTFVDWNLGVPNYFEVLRPPLYPLMISKIWWEFGENYILAVLVSPIFTVAAAALFCLLMKEMFDARTGLIASVGFLLSPIVMMNTDPVLVHGVGVFFVTASVYLLWRARTQPACYLLVGAVIALASLTRYPDMLIILVAIVFMLVDLKDNPQRRKSIVIWSSMGVSMLAVIWIPWLWWCQQIYKDPLVSLRLAYISGTAAGVIEHNWLFYINGLPNFLAVNLPSTTSSNVIVPGQFFIILGMVIGTALGGCFLFLGVAMKGAIKYRLLLATWFLTFLAYYSQVASQELRFMVEAAPPLFGFVGIGISRLFEFMKTRIHIRRTLYVSMSMIVGIWLVLLLLGSVAAEIPAFSHTYYEGQSYGLVSVTGFQLSTSWLRQHMNRTEIGVTDLAPFLTYYTGRFFYDWTYVLEVAAARHISIKEALTLLHIKYAVFRDYFAKANNINFAFLMKVQEFSGYLGTNQYRYEWIYTIYQIAE